MFRIAIILSWLAASAIASEDHIDAGETATTPGGNGNGKSIRLGRADDADPERATPSGPSKISSPFVPSFSKAPSKIDPRPVDPADPKLSKSGVSPLGSTYTTLIGQGPATTIPGNALTAFVLGAGTATQKAIVSETGTSGSGGGGSGGSGGGGSGGGSKSGSGGAGAQTPTPVPSPSPSKAPPSSPPPAGGAQGGGPGGGGAQGGGRGSNPSADPQTEFSREAMRAMIAALGRMGPDADELRRNVATPANRPLLPLVASLFAAYPGDPGRARELAEIAFRHPDTFAGALGVGVAAQLTSGDPARRLAGFRALEDLFRGRAAGTLAEGLPLD